MKFVLHLHLDLNYHLKKASHSDNQINQIIVSKFHVMLTRATQRAHLSKVCLGPLEQDITNKFGSARGWLSGRGRN